MTLLKMKGITKTFFGNRANDSVDFSIEKGEIHALLGENGAGKTTLMNILYGLYSADSGEIYLNDKLVRFDKPLDAIQAGINMVHQHFMLVPTMTVLENIILGLKLPGHPFIDTSKVEKELIEISKNYGFQIEPRRKVYDLSVGEQQRVEIMKALYRKAHILILDEPTAVLTPSEAKQFFEILGRLKKEGHSSILITHKMSDIMDVSDRVSVLRDGKMVTTVITSKTNPRELSYHMMGREMDICTSCPNVCPTDDVLLEASDICHTNKYGTSLKDLSFNLKTGSILGIAGVDGNGQKELGEVLMGIRKASSGDIVFKGQSIINDSVRMRFNKGLSYISDDRHHDGLVMDMNLQQNMLLNFCNRKPFVNRKILNWDEIEHFTEQAVEKYRIKTAGHSHPVRLLSGGNQQKLIIARQLGADPDLIIVSQPTRGLDIGAAQQVHEILLKQRDEGKGIILISADLDEILALSDCIAVMFRGQIMGIVYNSDSLPIRCIADMMVGISLENDIAEAVR